MRKKDSEFKGHTIKQRSECMKKLLEPFSIKGTTFNNRVVMPPMATSKSSVEGRVTDSHCNYYEDRAKGGYMGLIITEHSYITPQGKASKGQLSIAQDSDIDGLKKLVNSCQIDQTKVIAQINHAGSGTREDIPGFESVAPSAVINPLHNSKTKTLPKSLNDEEITLITQEFANAAVRAKLAGFDGVQIHSAHGYLLNQFYSPLTNHRTDKYGANSIENRIRFHLEVITAVRKAVGDDFIISLRFGGCDYCEGGSTIEDSVQAAKIFEQTEIDLLDISGGMCGYRILNQTGPGYFKEMTQAIKQATSIPVILTGGIVDAKSADQLLSENVADLIGVGRALLKDARWAEKACTLL